MSKKPAPQPPALVDPKNVLQLPPRKGISEERQLADLAIDGIASNAITTSQFLKGSQPGLSITEMVDSLTHQGKRVNANDLSGHEQLLSAQTAALNAIFAEMSRRAALNLGQHLDATERYMRLALKAQGQCRATVETLAAMKNPPVVFAKQANIANGPQQVNNGTAVGELSPQSEQYARARAPAGESISEQTKLLEGMNDGSTYMDAGTTGTTGRRDKALEPVEVINRTKKRGR